MQRLIVVAALALLASPPLLAAETPAYIAAAVAAPERSDKDRERDARDRPTEVMTFAGIRPGMTIADVFGGGGYWTELLARAVGTPRAGSPWSTMRPTSNSRARTSRRASQTTGCRASRAAPSRPAT